MEATVFNPLQVHLLQMFALDKSQKGLDELTYFTAIIRQKWRIGLMHCGSLGSLIRSDSTKSTRWISTN